MAEDWDEIATDVLAEINDIGFFVTLKKKPVKSGLEYAPTLTNPDPIEVKALRSRKRSSTYTSPSGVQFTEVLMMSAESGKEPSKDDKVVVNSKEFKVVDLETVAPGGVNLYHRVFLSA